jgi:PAS domain S-box-containing protein
VTKVFTNKFAKIEHPICIHKGGDYCRYIVSWQKTPYLVWKLINKYFFLLSILVSIALFFVLPIGPWVVLVLLNAFLSMALSFFSVHLEKKDLARAVETQGDTARDLIGEMNIRYNNALLIQEIGQASSTILDTENLVVAVTSAMQKHLDFDRGMIMLANQEETRLVYTSGYGYSKEQEGFLRGVEFHLDNPKSKGMFVLAFKEQKPFLVNDIVEDKEKLSKRSIELAISMGVRSIICVPIVYEKKSFGILAVDNVESKRPLTQSDINLLMGISAQLAVNIVEAISFEKLQDSEKKYRDLVENANSIILRMDTDGYITFFNEFAQKLFGYSEHEILGKNVRGTILPSSESATADLGKMLGAHRQNPVQPAVTEGQYVLRNGDTAWIAWTSKPIFDSNGQLKEILSIGSDLTELKRAGQEKESLEAQLHEAQKMEAIGTMAGGIAHDFNNILQGIIGYAQILLMGKETGDPDQKSLHEIERLVRTATELTKRLLIFSRKVESKLRPLDLNQEVEQVTKMLKRTIPRMIDIELHLGEDLKIINADPLQTEQIIMNLGVNARDAMLEGGKLIIKTENTTLDGGYSKDHLRAEPGQYVLLSVSDTGDGMDEETLEHIFEPFFTTKESGKGTGLGLAVVYGIVKSHNGYITCDSQPGRGTIFRIYFPVIEKEPERLKVREVEAPIKVGSETILLVDDEENIREPWKKILVEFGYTVFTTVDGESALEFYRKEHDRVDLIILDLIMPGMGGKRCLVKLLKINPEAKVIIASGYAIDASTKEAIEAGAKVFVSKPFEIRSMLKTVREVLDQG